MSTPTPEPELPWTLLTGTVLPGYAVLVTVWPDGTGEIAYRTSTDGTWSAPIPLAKQEVT